MAVDFFLKLDGIDGESENSDHKNEIQLLSWSWGGSQTSTVSGTGGSSAGKASLSDLNVMKHYDKASPKIFQALLKGTHIKSAVLTANKSTGDASGKAFLKLSLGELFVTSTQASASSEIPSESVSFSYNTVKVEYFVQGDQGTLTATAAVSYDLKANKVS